VPKLEQPQFRPGLPLALQAKEKSGLAYFYVIADVSIERQQGPGGAPQLVALDMPWEDNCRATKVVKATVQKEAGVNVVNKKMEVLVEEINSVKSKNGGCSPERFLSGASITSSKYHSRVSVNTLLNLLQTFVPFRRWRDNHRAQGPTVRNAHGATVFGPFLKASFKASHRRKGRWTPRKSDRTTVHLRKE
jgi:hypothetical protein